MVQDVVNLNSVTNTFFSIVNVMVFKLFLLAVFTASPAMAIGNDNNAMDLADELTRILTLIQPDSQRDEAVPFSDVTVECLPYEEQQAFVRVAEPLLTELKQSVSERRSQMNKVQIESATAKLLRLEYHIDAEIPQSDAENIAESIESNPFIDLRVLRFDYRDADTVLITTGVIGGPLSGGGSIYIARRENGSWVIRESSLWLH